MAGDVRLERKLMEDRLAEGVDGLDLQAARRLQRLGEQPARPAQLVGVRAVAFELLDLSATSSSSASAVHAGEVVVDALRHVGGSRARVGEAQDLRRVGALQQQPDDAPRQHMRLARAGIGRNPDGMRWDRRRSPAAGAISSGMLSGAFIRPRPARRRRPPTIRARGRGDRSRRRSRLRGTAERATDSPGRDRA